MSEAEARPTNFIRQIIDEDLASGKHTTVHTRFPPEPNGYLHIGHAKSICLNFGIAQDYKGQCNLRFDDTNPVKEDIEYVESIKNDVEWLGFHWSGNVRYSSDYFDQLHAYAIELINKGLAYVDELTPEQIREYRGTLTQPGKNSPYRDRSVEENLALFEKMRAGGFEEGKACLRAKIDMASPFIVMRGPVAAASAEATPATAAPVAKPQAVPNAVSIAELVSPITGDVVALDQVPDEAFASKAVGDGVAVKPTDKIVVSPAAGTIVKIFNTNHAFCLETEKGAEIVVHMGIDTVALEGKGFKRLVEEGAQVSAGQPILEMDLDYLNANARSMISPVVCSNIDDFSGLIIKAQGHVVAGQTPLYEIKK